MSYCSCSYRRSPQILGARWYDRALVCFLVIVVIVHDLENLLVQASSCAEKSPRQTLQPEARRGCAKNARPVACLIVKTITTPSCGANFSRPLCQPPSLGNVRRPPRRSSLGLMLRPRDTQLLSVAGKSIRVLRCTNGRGDFL